MSLNRSRSRHQQGHTARGDSTENCFLPFAVSRAAFLNSWPPPQFKACSVASFLSCHIALCSRVSISFLLKTLVIAFRAHLDNSG